MQSLEFTIEFECLVKRKEISCESKILSLNPFFDERNIMGVDGRMINLKISENSKHPIISSKNNHVTKLII